MIFKPQWQIEREKLLEENKKLKETQANDRLLERLEHIIRSEIRNEYNRYDR